MLRGNLFVVSVGWIISSTLMATACVSSSDYGTAGIRFDDIVDVLFQGENGENFGRSVSAAGDINGDGFSDLVVGASDNGARGTGAGRAYIYLGGRNGALDEPDVIVNGSKQYQALGMHVATAGDINGDGLSDVLFSDGGFQDDFYSSCQGHLYTGKSKIISNEDPVDFPVPRAPAYVPCAPLALAILTETASRTSSSESTRSPWLESVSRLADR